MSRDLRHYSWTDTATTIPTASAGNPAQGPQAAAEVGPGDGVAPVDVVEVQRVKPLAPTAVPASHSPAGRQRHRA